MNTVAPQLWVLDGNCCFLTWQVLEEFSRQVSKMDWLSGSPATISYSALDGYLSKYQVQTPRALQGTRPVFPCFLQP